MDKKEKREIDNQARVLRMKDRVLPSDRMRVLAKIIYENGGENKWTAQAIQDAALDHPWFQKYMPLYSKPTALADLKKLLAENGELKNVVADEYIAAHLQKTDDIIRRAERLLQRNQEALELALDALEALPDDYEDAEGETKGERMLSVIGKATRNQLNLATQITQAMGRQSAILPMTAPTELKISEKKELTLTHYIQLREQAKKADELPERIEQNDHERDFIEGEFSPE